MTITCSSPWRVVGKASVFASSPFAPRIRSECSTFGANRPYANIRDLRSIRPAVQSNSPPGPDPKAIDCCNIGSTAHEPARAFAGRSSISTVPSSSGLLDSTGSERGPNTHIISFLASGEWVWRLRHRGSRCPGSSPDSRNWSSYSSSQTTPIRFDWRNVWASKR